MTVPQTSPSANGMTRQPLCCYPGSGPLELLARQLWVRIGYWQSAWCDPPYEPHP